MRIKIEIEGDQVSVLTDDAKRIDEDQEEEKAWFRDAIGHRWIVMKAGETLTGNGLFAFTDAETELPYFVEDPNGYACKSYYKLPPMPEPESSK